LVVVAIMESVTRSREQRDTRQAGEQGYMLLGLIVAIAIILLTLSVAAADMAHTVRAERERESVRRANQYVRAIRLFYKKSGSYPASIKQLENTNLVRYLRQKYTDPLTGKEYRLIGVGQNQTTVKGFFGQPLGGIAGGGLGSLAGAQSPGGPGTPTAPGASATNGTTSTSPPGSSSPSGGTGLGSASGMASQGTGSSGSIGPFMGVGSNAKGDSILEVNGQTTYETWEFLYDPRIEKLYAAAALNGGINSGGTGTLGPSTTPGGTGFNSTGFGNTTNPASPTGPNTGTTPNGGTSPTGP